MGPHYKLLFEVPEKVLITAISWPLDFESFNWKNFPEIPKTTALRVTSKGCPRLFPNTEASLTYNISLIKNHCFKMKQVIHLSGWVYS